MSEMVFFAPPKTLSHLIDDASDILMLELIANDGRFGGLGMLEGLGKWPHRPRGAGGDVEIEIHWIRGRITHFGQPGKSQLMR